MPKISVLMPVRNAERTLKESIESILQQSSRDFEFLICDDASNDQTGSILKTFHDRRIRIVRNSEKKGVAGSLNRLLMRARGEFICRMDADDIARRDRLNMQTAFLQANPEIGLVGSYFEELARKKRRFVKFPTTHGSIRRVLPRFNPIRHPTIMMRQSVMQELKGYDESLEGAEDYDLVIRASSLTKLANIPKVLIRYRISDQSVSVSETQRILRRAIRARWKALLSGNFHWWESVFLLKPLASSIIPSTMKQWIMEGF